MSDNSTHSDPPAPQGRAPAEAVPRAPWPVWRKVIAYAMLGVLSIASIWYVDRKVHLPSAMPVSTAR